MKCRCLAWMGEIKERKVKEQKRETYTYRRIRDERQYGMYWYSGLWQVLRPVLVGLTVLVIVAGLLLTGWNRIYEAFIAPADVTDEAGYPFEISLTLEYLVHEVRRYKLLCVFLSFGYVCGRFKTFQLPCLFCPLLRS